VKAYKFTVVTRPGESFPGEPYSTEEAEAHIRSWLRVANIKVLRLNVEEVDVELHEPCADCGEDDPDLFEGGSRCIDCAPSGPGWDDSLYDDDEEEAPVE